MSRRAPFDVSILGSIFAERRFRLTALGYFGHMWELYAFWSLAASYLAASLGASYSLPLILFFTFAAGTVGCAGGGWVSQHIGERRVALGCIAVSGVMCVLSPLAFDVPDPLLIAYVLIWGVFVVADSPQFSALAARYCPPDYTGTALTAQNGIGFAITLGSIQLVPIIGQAAGWRWALLILAPGPALGAVALVALGRVEQDTRSANLPGPAAL